MIIHNTTRRGEKVGGFTLVETLVALSLSVLIVLGVSQVFIQGLRHIHGVRAQVLLTSDAGYMVQMIRNEIFGAETITLVNSSEVDIEKGGVTRTLTLTDGRVILKTVSDTIPITRDGVNVTNLVFEEVGKSLRIQFTFYSGLRTNKTFNGQTTFALRQ